MYKENYKKNINKKKKRIILCVVIIAILLVLSTIFAVLNLNNNKIISGISISGVDVSGLSKNEAVEKIKSIYNSKIEKEDVVMHLDKSHLTVHTYPESHPHKGISTFRADIEVSTCGQISPLKALNYLIQSFDSDILTVDYHVRGFTRDVSGKKIYIDHRINSIQNYINAKTRNMYNMIDVNVYQENIFHTKMMLKEFDLDNYLFGITEAELSEREIKQIKHQLKQEMMEIFYGRNLPSVKA